MTAKRLVWRAPRRVVRSVAVELLQDRAGGRRGRRPIAPAVPGGRGRARAPPHRGAEEGPHEDVQRGVEPLEGETDADHATVLRGGGGMGQRRGGGGHASSTSDAEFSPHPSPQTRAGTGPSRKAYSARTSGAKISRHAQYWAAVTCHETLTPPPSSQPNHHWNEWCRTVQPLASVAPLSTIRAAAAAMLLSIAHMRAVLPSCRHAETDGGRHTRPSARALKIGTRHQARCRSRKSQVPYRLGPVSGDFGGAHVFWALKRPFHPLSALDQTTTRGHSAQIS